MVHCIQELGKDWLPYCTYHTARAAWRDSLLAIYMGAVPRYGVHCHHTWGVGPCCCPESMVLLLSMKDRPTKGCMPSTHPTPAVQFKIEPFKHPVKMDPNYGGEQDSRVLSGSVPG